MSYNYFGESWAKDHDLDNLRSLDEQLMGDY
jgi:hypothetical protein